MFTIYTCTSFGVNIGVSGTGVLEKKIFKTPTKYSQFRSYVPFKKSYALYYNNLIPFAQGCFVLSFVKFDPLVLEQK